jgi:hypothetical protein
MFNDSGDGTPLSVHVAQPGERADDYLAAQCVLTPTFTGGAVVELVAGTVRKLPMLDVIPAPKADDPWHAYVTGNKTKAIRSQLAKDAVPVTALPQLGRKQP